MVESKVDIEPNVENNEESEENIHTQVEIEGDGGIFFQKLEKERKFENIARNVENRDIIEIKCEKSKDQNEKQDQNEKDTKNDENFEIIQKSFEEDKKTEEIYGKNDVEIKKCIKIVEIDTKCENVETEPIDYALEEAGPFGIRQIIHLLLMLMPIILSGTYDMNFIVTSATDEYRCRIPECDVSDKYDQNWLRNAIPRQKHDDRLRKCVRYNLVSLRPNATDAFCPASIFNTSDPISCNDFVFKSDEHRLMKEFGIYCDENEYKLAMVGTVNNIAIFMSMPITGILADKYGRRPVLAFATFFCGIFGIAKAFVPTYEAFIGLEFIGAAFGACLFNVGLILCVEGLPSKYRLLASTIVASTYAFGNIFLGAMAIILPHYRMFLVAIYAPALPIILYLYIVPESPRWLHTTGQIDKLLKVLNVQALRNGYELSKKSVAFLSKLELSQSLEECPASKHMPITAIFQHSVLYLRLMACSLLWALVTLTYYGISVKSTKFEDDDNKYLTYITTVTAQIPAAMFIYVFLENIGRRTALSCTTTITGIALFLAAFMPPHHSAYIRAILFIGMMAQSSTFTVMFVFTIEFWPTQLRTTLTNVCAMVGCVGSIIAPLAILLDQYEESVSVLVYGTAGFLAAAVVHLLPETKGKNLPETIEDSIHL